MDSFSNAAGRASAERLRRSLNDQQAFVEGLNDVAGGITTLTGEFLLKSSGEKKIVLNFPVAFTDKPILGFSGEIPEGDEIVDGDFPIVSAIVSRWITRENPPFARTFVGCELAIVVTGPSTQKMIFFWSMSGNTIVNIGD